MRKILFYVLSCTWGIIMTVIGAVAAIILKARGYVPKKHGWCYHFEYGYGWGGVNLGIVMITSIAPSDHTKNHEHGHALQNCIWGPLMPFVIALPSAIRYHRRNKQQKQGMKLEPYDSVWYEADATKRGNALMDSFKE